MRCSSGLGRTLCNGTGISVGEGYGASLPIISILLNLIATDLSSAGFDLMTTGNSFKAKRCDCGGFIRGLASPSGIQRLGLRFINRIELPVDGPPPDDYLRMPSEVLAGMPLSRAGFFHRDVLAVPGYPYIITIVRTVQPIQVAGSKGFGLLLDIDVFSTESFELGGDLLTQRLDEMRWLKNKAFFGSITEQALESFQ